MPRAAIHAACALLLVTLVAPSAGAQSVIPLAIPDAWKLVYRRPAEIPFPPENRFSEAKFELGRKLFFDPTLSSTGTIACATCHVPRYAWGSPPVRPAGADGRPPPRKPPSLLDLAWADQLMWDGSQADLDSQALEPLTNPGIMGNTMPALIARLGATAEYDAAFAAAFPRRGLTAETIGQALGTFERTLVSPPSAFDGWIAGDERAISRLAKRGFVVFNDMSTRCADCHSGWRFTDGTFRDTGMTDADLGRGKLRPDVGYLQHAFKTAGLRQVSDRAPYMHDGSIATLDAVIDHYATPRVRRASMPEYIRGFRLTPAERSALKAFLATLSVPEPPAPE
ncbi:MAG TPA: cytochrome c peroxidase [Candidatus Sulfotelmatobacter sp.]|nr:cytochrome c peroxidase [Candidatus Sulfotelmatobacter sp.]